jgi:hypothetical protein
MYVFSVLVLCMCALLQQAQSISDTQKLTQLEATWNDAHLKGDTATLDGSGQMIWKVVVPEADVKSAVACLCPVGTDAFSAL